MATKRRLGWLLGFAPLVACGATLVNSARAPAAKQGVVKYLDQGADSVIQSRRESAFEVMAEDCGGPFAVTWEKSGEEAVEFLLMDTSFRSYGKDSEAQRYRYLGYTCGDP